MVSPTSCSVQWRVNYCNEGRVYDGSYLCTEACTVGALEPCLALISDPVGRYTRGRTIRSLFVLLQ